MLATRYLPLLLAALALVLFLTACGGKGGGY
jgi:predicted small lipoprotein YifL